MFNFKKIEELKKMLHLANEEIKHQKFEIMMLKKIIKDQNEKEKIYDKTDSVNS